MYGRSRVCVSLPYLDLKFQRKTCKVTKRHCECEEMDNVCHSRDQHRRLIWNCILAAGTSICGVPRQLDSAGEDISANICASYIGVQMGDNLMKLI